MKQPPILEPSMMPPEAPAAVSDEQVGAPEPVRAARTGPASGCVLPAASHDEVRRLLADRTRLSDRLVELDAEGERLTRAVQRVGGVTNAPRQFTGAPPMLVSSTSELDHRLGRLSSEMQELTATISAQELKLQDLDQPSRRRRVAKIIVLLVVIAAAAGLATYLAVT